MEAEPSGQVPAAPPKAEPLLIVVSGPSGVGKDLTVRGLEKRNPEYHFLVTYTTRAPRDNEREGVDYHFVSKDEFTAGVARGEFLENSEVYQSNLYGSKRRDVREALACGQDVIMRVDVQGAAKIQRCVEGAIYIFLFATPAELEQRLRRRRSESEASLRERLEKAVHELTQMPLFDYVVPNREERIDQTVADIEAIIRAEKLKAHPRRVRFLES